ncbi:MAG: (2Fe-2S)-binding protein [SAR86 cluster bacterium]|uniref:(2Fe-2S)-binding protein n=1 Tax=SAR86 cluster bacterium TaxID=2030880 RepID=A0A2A5B2K1_9GAMM|nr:MAG: (2Fe-2S)-binding protein [SAR86 cluster bacterium]
MITLMSIDDIAEGTSKGLELNNLYMFAVKKDNQIFLYWNRCPHLGTPLEWEEDRFLDADGALIQCSTHGALFQIEDGNCLAGPCKGKNLHAIKFQIDDGMIMVEESELRMPTPL